jgi:cytidine deaminase
MNAPAHSGEGRPDLFGLASEVVGRRALADDHTAGSVGAALLTAAGNIYRGVCIDTGSGMGFCAEHAAVAAMVTAGESRIVAVVAVGQDEADGTFYVLPPCGRCREFMSQIDAANRDADVMVDRTTTKKLGDLLPYHHR